MESSPLTDKDMFPSKEVIFSHIGKSKALWLSFFEQIRKDHPDFEEEWRYYNDGKCWLMKVTRKKKTIFWLSVLPKSFRITFYFTEKAKGQILKSAIAEELKDQFVNGKQYNKIRGVTIHCRKKTDLAAVAALMEIKSALH